MPKLREFCNCIETFGGRGGGGVDIEIYRLPETSASLSSQTYELSSEIKSISFATIFILNYN